MKDFTQVSIALTACFVVMIVLDQLLYQRVTWFLVGFLIAMWTVTLGIESISYVISKRAEARR